MRTPIESLLNIRRWKEDEAKNRFASVLKELAAEENRLLCLEDDYKAVSGKLDCNADELVNIQELVRLNEYLEHLLLMIHRQIKVIAEKERQVEVARRALIEASKDKKVMEKLDEKKKDEVKGELRRKEQKRTDESAAVRHGRHAK